jgi:hypothetical protein
MARLSDEDNTRVFTDHNVYILGAGFSVHAFIDRLGESNHAKTNRDSSSLAGRLCDAKLWSDDFELISRTSLDRMCRILKVQPGKLITYDSAYK